MGQGEQDGEKVLENEGKEMKEGDGNEEEIQEVTTCLNSASKPP